MYAYTYAYILYEWTVCGLAPLALCMYYTLYIGIWYMASVTFDTPEPPGDMKGDNWLATVYLGFVKA